MFLDTVIHAVSDEVHERILEAVHDGLVYLCILAFHNELYVLVELLFHVADDTVHLLEYSGKRNHSDGHYGILKLACELSELAGSLVEAFKLKAVEIRVGNNHGLGGDDLAYYVVQSVELCKIDADEGLLLSAAGSSLSLFNSSLCLLNGGLCRRMLSRSGRWSSCRSRRCRCGSRSLRLRRKLGLCRFGGSSRGSAYHFVALNVERALDRLEHLVNAVMRNECDKEALVDDLLGSFRVVLHIGRLEFKFLAGVLDGVYQQECTEVLHLAAVLKENADSGLVVCCGRRSGRSGGRSRTVCSDLRVGSGSGSDSLSLSRGIALGFADQSVARL